MNITEAYDVVKLLRHIDGSQPNIERATAATVYLAARASQALQMPVTLDERRLVETLSEVER